MSICFTNPSNLMSVFTHYSLNTCSVYFVLYIKHITSVCIQVPPFNWDGPSSHSERGTSRSRPQRSDPPRALDISVRTMFKHVEHWTILHRLENTFGISGSMLDWIELYITTAGNNSSRSITPPQRYELLSMKCHRAQYISVYISNRPLILCENWFVFFTFHHHTHWHASGLCSGSTAFCPFHITSRKCHKFCSVRPK